MFEGFSLFLGALADALIGPNLFVPGEPFFIAAGYQLYQGAWSAVLFVMIGGLVGDQLSYFIGLHCGQRVQRKIILVQPKTKRLIARCRYLMAKRGSYIIMFARLLGPIAWIVPFIAGSHKVKWRSFSVFSIVGLILGGGQFIIWGLILAHGVEHFPLLNEAKIFVVEHQITLLALVLVTLMGIIGYRYRWRYLFAKVSVLLVTLLVYCNYAHFFWYSDDFNTEVNNKVKASESSSELSYKAFPGKSAYYDAQAINIQYIGETPRPLMNTLGWIENKTFSRNEIEFAGYVSLLRSQTPPVSDLYWQKKPQDMAFQLPGTLMKRSHIRWWKVGVQPETKQPLWLGAISYDDGLKLTSYSGIMTILHSIDPNVDKERDKLEEQIKQQRPDIRIEKQQLVQQEVMDEEHDYYTDGNILIISG
ncbi:MAG: LssY C-terminal domain-containing protein [Vibrio gallaecicus]